MAILHLLQTVLLLSPLTLADGLYSKSSPVLQVDARSYTRLIEKSNYTSIVEFYAPWCGHCKNLKGPFEKVAKSLAGYAKVAAINCDEDSNKPFCGQMGVQGFPTLKIVKPKKKGGKPIVEDYQGARTAKAIDEAVLDKMPNHVRKLTDKDVEDFMKKGDKPKAVFFTEKASVSPLVKSIAIDFLGSLDVAQVKSTEKKATEMFMVDQFPKLAFLMGANHVPTIYSGELKKDAVVAFLEDSGAGKRNPEWTTEAPKPKKDKKPNSKKAEAKKDEKKPPPGHPTGTGKCPVAHADAPAASEVLEEETMNPTATASPDPAVSESPAPVHVPVESAPELQNLESESALQKTCLNLKSGTCVLAIVSSGADHQKTGLQSLKDIAYKHALRRAKLFPFYSVPETNEAGQGLLKSLSISDPSAHATILAVNAKRGWWTRYSSEDLSQKSLEDWIDNIRFGDFKKESLPDGVVPQAEEKAKEEDIAGEKVTPEEPPEGLKVEVVEDTHDEL